MNNDADAKAAGQWEAGQILSLAVAEGVWIGTTYGVSRNLAAGLDILSDGYTFASVLDAPSAKWDGVDLNP